MSRLQRPRYERRAHLPTKALQTDEDGSDGVRRAQRQRDSKSAPLRQGWSNTAALQVLEGVKEGEKVVTDGQLHSEIRDAQRRAWERNNAMINPILEFLRPPADAGHPRPHSFSLASVLLALKQIPIDAFPDVTNVQVQVLATAGGMSPPEVEKLVTRPIEMQNGRSAATRKKSAPSRRSVSARSRSCSRTGWTITSRASW